MPVESAIGYEEKQLLDILASVMAEIVIKTEVDNSDG